MIRRLLLVIASATAIVAVAVALAIHTDPVLNRVDPAVISASGSNIGEQLRMLSTVPSGSADLSMNKATPSAPHGVVADSAHPPSSVNGARGEGVRLEARSINLNAEVDPYTAQDAARDGGIDPASMSRPVWYSAPAAGDAPATGVPPKSDTNTIYVYGHTWNKPAVFNDLKKLKVGEEVTLTQGDEVVRYRVTKVLEPTIKADLPKDGDYTAVVPGRLVLVGCYRATGKEEHTTENIAVITERI